MILGLVHAVVLRNGDILLPYAAMMMLVTFCYRWSTRQLIAAIVLTFLFMATAPQLWTLAVGRIPSRPGPEGGNIDWLLYWYKTAPIYWESTLFLLLTGLLIGRWFIQQQRKLSRRQLMIFALAGGLTGVAGYWGMKNGGTFIESIPDFSSTHFVRAIIARLFLQMHTMGMALAYAGIVFLVLSKISLNIFAILGRTSLSNYILQAVIVVPLCLAFDLYGRMTPLLALVMCVTIWTLQVRLSMWWLKHHRFGPLEWLLRVFSYGRFEVNRNRSSANQPVKEDGSTKIITPMEGEKLV